MYSLFKITRYGTIDHPKQQKIYFYSNDARKPAWKDKNVSLSTKRTWRNSERKISMIASSWRRHAQRPILVQSNTWGRNITPISWRRSENQNYLFGAIKIPQDKPKVIILYLQKDLFWYANHRQQPWHWCGPCKVVWILTSSQDNLRSISKSGFTLTG